MTARPISLSITEGALGTGRLENWLSLVPKKGKSFFGKGSVNRQSPKTGSGMLISLSIINEWTRWSDHFVLKGGLRSH